MTDADSVYEITNGGMYESMKEKEEEKGRCRVIEM
jgi:hypothetical protein